MGIVQDGSELLRKMNKIAADRAGDFTQQEMEEAQRFVDAYRLGETKDPTREGEIRKFGTGATRDTDEGKLDYEGFLSPAVLRRYAQYMHKHRQLPNGQLRDSDNWQEGIPQEAYMKSLWRHFMDVWAYQRQMDDYPEEPYEDALCALIFNAMGLLFEHMANAHNLPRNPTKGPSEEPASPSEGSTSPGGL